MGRSARVDEAIIKNEASTINMDANETIFFSRELEHVKAATYTEYPQLSGIDGSIIPIDTSAGPAAKTISYKVFSQAGMAKVISNYADDLPLSSISAKEFFANVRSIGIAYSFSIMDIRSAAAEKRPLKQDEAAAAAEGDAITVNNIAFNGDAKNNLQGLLTNVNIPEYVIPADGAGGGGSRTELKYKTPDQCIRDLNGPIIQMIGVTKNIEKPDTLTLPPTIRADLSSRRMGDGSDTTILEFFLMNNGYIKNIVDCIEFTGAGSGGEDMMMHYKKDKKKLSLEIPQSFEQFPVQRNNLAFKIPCHSRTGGVIVRRPLSLVKTEGI